MSAMLDIENFHESVGLHVGARLRTYGFSDTRSATDCAEKPQPNYYIELRVYQNDKEFVFGYLYLNDHEIGAEGGRKWILYFYGTDNMTKATETAKMLSEEFHVAVHVCPREGEMKDAESFGLPDCCH